MTPAAASAPPPSGLTPPPSSAPSRIPPQLANLPWPQIAAGALCVGAGVSLGMRIARKMAPVKVVPAPAQPCADCAERAIREARASYQPTTGAPPVTHTVPNAAVPMTAPPPPIHDVPDAPAPTAPAHPVPDLASEMAGITGGH